MAHSIETMISEAELQAQVVKLAAEIDKDYTEQDNLLLVGLLKGSVLFMADLCRAMKTPISMDFMNVSSYGAGTESSGDVKVLKDLDQDIKGRHILIVEDIIDTGNTLNKVVEMLKLRDPASLKIASLLDKPSRRVVNVPVDYIGFEIPDEFVIGYGLDWAEKYRDLPFIGKVIQQG